MFVKYYIQAVEKASGDIYFVAFDENVGFYLTKYEDEVCIVSNFKEVKEIGYSITNDPTLKNNYIFTFCELRPEPVYEFNRATKDDKGNFFFYKLEIKEKE